MSGEKENVFKSLKEVFKRSGSRHTKIEGSLK
jgi:hypothetical protein